MNLKQFHSKSSMQLWLLDLQSLLLDYVMELVILLFGSLWILL
uniref:Uncharacterized protein n=1 Tax=Rhizophora mucronata TaxID=61149 RepID=A0A2P2NK49_RHIMU